MNTNSILIGIVIGGTIIFTIMKINPRIKLWLSGITGLIKRYWMVSLILLAVSGLLEVTIYTKFPARQNYLDTLHFYIGLLFAIFTGYFGFKQLQNYKFDKLVDEAYQYLQKGDYNRAKKLYSEALYIDSSTYTVVGNLAELALICDDKEQFESLIHKLDKVVLEVKEKITPLYLKTAKYLFEENIAMVKKQLRELFSYIVENPDALEKYNWSFKEIQSSKRYKDLNGESKNIFGKLISLLSRSMDEIEKEKFMKEYS